MTAKFVFGIGALALLVAFNGSVVAANSVTLYTNSYTSSPGGEFTAISSSLDPNTLGYSALAENTISGKLGFETFCLENSVTFSPGTAYNYTIQQTIIPQGGSLTLGVAWLYSEFATGQLADYYYGTTGHDGTQNHGSLDFLSRKSAAGSLQQAIWYLQGEISKPSNNVFLNLLTASASSGGAGFVSLTAAEVAANGTYGVAVLDMTDQRGAYAQDQLVLNPSGGGNTIPVPDGGATAGLLALALAGLAFFQRRLLPRVG